MPRQKLTTDMVRATVVVQPSLLWKGRDDALADLRGVPLVVRAAYLKEGDPMVMAERTDSGDMVELFMAHLQVVPPNEEE